MPKNIPAALAVAAAVLSAGISAAAQRTTHEERAVFNISVANIRVASLVAASRNNGRSYAVRAFLRSEGLLDLLARRTIDVRVRGWLRTENYEPVTYQETKTERKSENRLVLEYRRGVPHLTLVYPPLAEDSSFPDSERWRGSLDPATALFTVIRDYGKDEMCDSEFLMFDGKKTYQFVLGKPITRDEEIHCESSSTRVEGFTAEEMAELETVPFTLVYRLSGADPDRYELRRLTAPTTYGTLKATRE